jgi:hypothetical protein
MFRYDDKYYMLFSKNGFKDDVRKIVNNNNKVILVDFKDM